jgi:hypothetical protein
LLKDIPYKELLDALWCKVLPVHNTLPGNPWQGELLIFWPDAERLRSHYISSNKQQHTDGYQARRVRASLKRLYPNGVPGRDVITTSALRRQVITDLKDETGRLGLSDPSWQVVDRVRDDC